MVRLLVERCLGDVSSEANRLYNKILNTNGSVQTLRYRASLSHTGKTALDTIYSQPDVYRNMKVIPDAVKELKSIVARGDELVLYTHCVHINVIREWLDKWYPEYSSYLL